MYIGIIGTRGIPNYYGGFEQFAEYLAVQLVKDEHTVSVYNSHDHPHQSHEYKGVSIIHCYDPGNFMGLAGQFIYDFNCIIDARSRNFDLILQLGYTTNSVWGWLLPSKSIIVTNMDGVEWMRSKYPPLIQRFLKHAEKWAVQTSDYLVADSIGIQKHLKGLYEKPSTYIPYGSYVFENPEISYLNEFHLEPYQYNMLIARLQSDNSIDEILKGVSEANVTRPFLVIGNHNTRYGKYLVDKYRHFRNIMFLGGIYDLDKLNNLRYHSNLYFHGHRVGGTNPSLLEAMGSSALICAYNNIFNKSILGDDAYYFENSLDVTLVLNSYKKQDNMSFVNKNCKKIATIYHWPLITSQYEELFLDVHSKKVETLSLAITE
ncbi:DUF1972 domain-containing protein [Spirosoma radiotolerans]|uniref:Glycosyl transferase family 1 n=1 Tax=Spirosoma radiotolerans TaxID=1379870 RepID=A0A0E3ZWY1_9BACT|nr:DUF1972 domain-containing protein [Spirosoma radiotolerans]AKD56050.1 glycosyl transferase family 1 [Spirosoma radiotolerans]